MPRKLRYGILLSNSVINDFVWLYYAYSPPLADFIARHDALRVLMHWSLLPLIEFGSIALRLGFAPALLLTLSLLLMLSATLVGLSRRLRPIEWRS